MADCYKYKQLSDIQKNFSNNLDIVLELPKHHTDVYWYPAKTISSPGEQMAQGANSELMSKQDFEK